MKIHVLIDTLRELFEEYGTIIDIVAKKNLKAKVQAFIVYQNAEEAQIAINELQDFDLFGREMRLDFAKTRSDAIVRREDGEEGLETHKRHRLAEKGMQLNEMTCCHALMLCRAQASRRNRSTAVSQTSSFRHSCRASSQDS